MNVLRNSLDVGDPFRNEISFVAVFEERVDFRRVFQLPFNMLVGVLDDGGLDNSPICDIDHDEWHSRRKGWLYFNPWNQKVLYETHPNLHYIAVHFKMELYPGFDLFQRETRWSFEYAPAEVKCLETAFRTREPLLRMSRLREFCLRFCNRHWPESVEDDPPVKRFENVLKYVGTHVSAATTVGELARMMNLRPETFSRDFTRAFGASPKEYLQNLLTSRAVRLLACQDRSVKEIAFALNFKSEFYFSKFFKRRTGIPPVSFRLRQSGGKGRKNGPET